MFKSDVFYISVTRVGKLMLCWLIFSREFSVSLFAQKNAVTGPEQGSHFAFALNDSSGTSAGVYDKSGVLIRTLWNGRKLSPGSYEQYWDGTDDDGKLVEEGNYFVRVLYNNVKYTWEGVIGNNSDSFTGNSVFRGYGSINDMAIAGNTAYYCTGYSEGSAGNAKFLLNNPHAKKWLNDRWRVPSLLTYAVATDGVNVYWAITDPPDTARSFVFATKTSNDADWAFSNGEAFTTKFGVGFKSVVDLLNNKNGKPTGMAVQKKGRYLLIAHTALNEIHVLDKQTGALVQTISINSPTCMAMDAMDNVWVCFTENNAQVVKKFELAGNGTLSQAKLTLAGVANPIAVAVSPDNRYVVVADAGNSQQLKAFYNQTGNAEWVYGELGGYANGPAVSYKKFYFTDNRVSFSRLRQAFIAFQPDGSFWAADPGNARVLHFSAERKYLDQIMYLPVSYSCVADPNNPERVFSDYLEFKVDYSKPLGPGNGSWTLVKNWGATVPDSLDAHFHRLASLTTLKNGRTYALFAQSTWWQLAELPTEGLLRFTGIKIPGFPATLLCKDGSLRTTQRMVTGKPVVFTIKKLTGFDNANNPVWGNEQVLATSPPAAKEDPLYWGRGILRSGEITSSGILVSFDNGLPPHGSDGYHLGGINVGDNKWLWKTAKITSFKYSGEYPADGSYDIGNQVGYGGSVHLVDGRNIFWGYHGEFWKSSQVNKWNHVWDDGLLVGQFGTTGVDNQGEAAAGMAGNAFSASVVHINDSTIYLYHNDESYHSGIHRWKISGLNSIKELVVPVEIKASPEHGLFAKVYGDTVFNNTNAVFSGVLPLNDSFAERQAFGKNSVSKKYSMVLSGFIRPLLDQVYFFYTGVSYGSRLWVNGQSLVDNFATGNKHSDSGSVYLTAGKEYPVLMEFYTTNDNEQPVLCWSSNTIAKQPVPTGQLLPVANLPQSNVFDLMEGLRHDGMLENGLRGWRRDPANDDSADRHSKWWNVRTGVKKFDAQLSPDVYIVRRQASGIAQISRDLGDDTTPVNKWELYGNINYEKNMPNVGESPQSEGSGGCFFEVLDNTGKILLRFYPVVLHYWDDVRLYANDKVVWQSNIDVFRKFVEHSNKIDVRVSNGKLSVQFANLPRVNIASFDAGVSMQHPKTMRVFFWGNGNNYDRIIDLEGFYFKRGKAN